MNALDRALSRDHELRNLYRAWRAGSLGDDGRAILAGELRENGLDELATKVEETVQ